MLFIITLVVNMCARLIVARYKEILPRGQLMTTLTETRPNPLTAGQR